MNHGVVCGFLVCFRAAHDCSTCSVCVTCVCASLRVGHFSCRARLRREQLQDLCVSDGLSAQSWAEKSGNIIIHAFVCVCVDNQWESGWGPGFSRKFGASACYCQETDGRHQRVLNTEGRTIDTYNQSQSVVRRDTAERTPPPRIQPRSITLSSEVLVKYLHLIFPGSITEVNLAACHRVSSVRTENQ